MNQSALHNRPPVNCPRTKVKRSQKVRIIYSSKHKVFALHHAKARIYGPIYVELTKLETAAQLLRVITDVAYLAPELLVRFVGALDAVLIQTFRFHLYEIGRGRNGPRLDWKAKGVFKY